MTSLEQHIDLLKDKDEDWNDHDHIHFRSWEELQNIKKEAKKLALKEYYLSHERLRIKAGKNTIIPIADIKEMEEFRNIIKEQKKSDDPKYAAFITVNPKINDTSGYIELNKKVEKCVAKFWVTDYAYCYEQRSTDSKSIHGLHTHILLTRGSHKPSHCEREIQSTFGPLCGNSKHINIQWKKKEWLKDKISYMLGDKTGDGKDLKIPIDNIMRESLGIEKIKYRGELFSDIIVQCPASSKDHSNPANVQPKSQA